MYYQQQRNEVMPLLRATAREPAQLAEKLPADITPQLIHDLFDMQIEIERPPTASTANHRRPPVAAALSAQGQRLRALRRRSPRLPDQ